MKQTLAFHLFLVKNLNSFKWPNSTPHRKLRAKNHFISPFLIFIFVFHFKKMKYTKAGKQLGEWEVNGGIHGKRNFS